MVRLLVEDQKGGSSEGNLEGHLTGRDDSQLFHSIRLLFSCQG